MKIIRKPEVFLRVMLLLFVATLFLLSGSLLAPNKLSAYESQQTLKLKTEVDQLEITLLAKQRELQSAAISVVENYITAGALEKAAAEAERKANVQKTMVFVKVGYDTASTLASPPTSIKDFLLGKITEMANSASWDIKFEYKLSRPDELPATAEIAFLKARQRAQEKVSWAKSDKAASQGKELEEGTNEYNYFMFKGFAEGLNEQAGNSRKLHAESKQRYQQIKSEISALETKITERKNLLGEQKKTDDLYAAMKSAIEKETAAEEARHKELRERVLQNQKGGIADAGSVSFGNELGDIAKAGSSLIGGAISYETYNVVIDAARLRAVNKKEVAIKDPPGLSGDNLSRWRKEQKKFIDDKYEEFYKNAEVEYDRVVDAATKCRNEVASMSEPAGRIFYLDGKDVLYEYRDELEKNLPQQTVFLPQYIWARGDSLEDVVKKYNDILADFPKIRSEITARRAAMISANEKYNQKRIALTNQYNEIVAKVNEYVKKNFSLLRHYNKSNKGGMGDMEYLSAGGIKNIFPTDNMDYQLAECDRMEKRIKEKIALANRAISDEKNLGGKITAFNKKTGELSLAIDEKIRNVHSEKTTTKELDKKLKDLREAVVAHRKNLLKHRENAEGLMMMAGYMRSDYQEDGDIAKVFIQKVKYMNDEIKRVDKMIDLLEEKEDLANWSWSAGQVLVRYGKLLENFQKEEKTLKDGLSKYLQTAQGIKQKFSSVSARNPSDLPSDSSTAEYFYKGKRPSLDYEKIRKECAAALPPTKDKSFDYFSDNRRDFHPDEEVSKLRLEITNTLSAIYEMSWAAGVAYEPGNIDSVNIENTLIYSNTRTNTITLYRDQRNNDTLEIKGSVDKPQNIKDIEISLDGGMSYRSGIIALAGKNFSGAIELIPNRAIEIKLRAKSTRGDDYSEFPFVGKGIEIFYSTEEPSRDIKDALADMISAYESETLPGFMRYISQDFVGRYENMENAIRRDFASYDLIRMKLFVDKVVISPNRDFATADAHWERSWLVTATNKADTSQSGVNTFRLQKTANNWKLVSYSGTPLFGLSVKSTLDNPNQSDITAVPPLLAEVKLPIRTGQTMKNHYTWDVHGEFGFSFVLGVIVTVDNSTSADMEFVGAPNSTSVKGEVGIYDFGAVSLDKVSEAPSVGYSLEESAVVGHAYVVKCRNNNYAKFRITAIDNTPDVYGNATSMTFDWAYQPDGSVNLK